MGRKITYTAGIPGNTRELTVEVHDLDADPWPVDAELSVVGTDVPRLDGVAKATGTATYTQDVQLAGLAFAGVVACPHAHAKVAKVDLSAAEKLPGVLATRAFEGKEIRYPGDNAAAVCAASKAELVDALAAVQVTYEVLDHVVDVGSALEDNVRVAPRRSNDNAPRRPMRRGDPDAAWDGAEVKVEETYTTAIQTHTALEPHGCVVAPGDDGSATVWASTQATSFFASPPLARAVGVPRNKIRVITEHMGGGFGAKFGAGPWDVLCAEFAKETGRPVQYLLPRRLEHLLGGNRPDSIQRMELGGKKDGTFTVLRGQTHGTAGNSRGGAGSANFMVYRFPNVEMAQHTVATHTARAAAFRAPRHPQGFFAMESLIDLFAMQIGKDPLEVRLANDDHPVRAMQWKLGAERIGWAEKRAAWPGKGEGPIRRGVGCAAARWSNAGRGAWKVDVALDREGGITVRSGVQDIGTGTRTLLAVLVAEELQIAPSTIDVELGDTRFHPGPASGGSTTAPSLGPAAREAGLRAREVLEDALRGAWELDAKATLTFEGGVFQASGKKASVREAMSLLPAQGETVTGQRRPNYEGYERETAGCQFAEVSVDIETGVVRVDRVVAVHDCGRIINPLTTRSQVNGGVIQGVGFALHEERHLDRAMGDMVNPTMDTYKIPTMADCPEIEVLLTSVVSGFNSCGMMGIGEPATVPTAGAIANAVFHALGVQVTALPMTPARVLEALDRRNG